MHVRCSKKSLWITVYTQFNQDPCIWSWTNVYINVTGVDAFVWLNEPNHCINTVECIPAECTQRTFSIDSEITQEIHQSHFPLLWLKREIIKYTQKLSFLGIFQNRKNKKPYVFYNRKISRSIFSTYSDKYIVS